MPRERSTRSVSSGMKRSQLVKAKLRLARNRGVLAVIAAAAKAGLKIRIRYTKVGTGETVDRVLEPYAFRYGNSSLGPGRWKYLYGYHGKHQSIEKYLVANIHAAKLTKYEYVPRWPVEIA